MNIIFNCSKCHSEARTEIPSEAASFACPACAVDYPIPSGAVVDGKLHRCLVCPSTDLFVRKDFSPRIGVTIVMLGIIASSIAWAYYYTYVAYSILFVTALIDVVFYFTLGDCLNCYRCGAIYRHTPTEHLAAFDLETHERYRQQMARISQSHQGGDGAISTR
jgi:hypothetical protein